MYRSGVSVMWSGELALLLIEKLSFKLQKKPNKTEDHSPEERNSKSHPCLLASYIMATSSDISMILGLKLFFS